MNTFEAAEKNGRAGALEEEPATLLASKNVSTSTGKTSIPATFLRVTVNVS